MTAMRKPLGREGLMNVLLAPHVTEKTSLGLQERNQYAFKVRREATRTDVRRAVELMFEVKVEGVQVVNQPGRSAASARATAAPRTGRRPMCGWPKARASTMKPRASAEILRNHPWP